MRNAIVLCAGNSTRMKSEKSKVLHDIIDRPIIKHIEESLQKLNLNKTVFVVNNSNAQQIKELLGSNHFYDVQHEQLGTAHAVLSAESLKNDAGKTLVVMGDCPLINVELIEKMFEKAQTNDLVLLTAVLEFQNSYGKIIKNGGGKIEKIVEHVDLSFNQKHIKEVNTGIYVFKNNVLFKFLSYISNGNSKKEYRLTDIVELMFKNNYKIHTITTPNMSDWLSVNTRKELLDAQKLLVEQINLSHLDNGVLISDMQNVVIGRDVVIESDVIVHENVKILGKSEIKKGAIIGAGSYIKDSVICENVVVNSSQVTDSFIGKDTKIGPFAHVRSHTKIGIHCRVGNFVEIKNSELKNSVRCAHLTYLGDCEIEDNVNIGCGVVTVNYDGKEKHKTKIMKNSFIGSGVNLIAPIVVGENCVVAAGSTINHNVESGDMAIARSYQVNKTGYGERYLKK